MTDQQSGHVQVTFRKAVSDGAYGTESAEVTLSRDGLLVAQADMAELLLCEARALVHAELGHSPSSNVRRALEPPVDRWKRAEAAAEAELAAGLREIVDDTRDEDFDEAFPP